MWHKISLFVGFICLISISAVGQTDFNGIWEGSITMEKDGKELQSFKFILQLNQDSLKVEGESWIWYKESKANFQVVGEVVDNQLILKDFKIISADKLPSGEWCEKNMQLSISYTKKKAKLEGQWQGKTTFSECTPGKILLKKNTDKV